MAAATRPGSSEQKLPEPGSGASSDDSPVTGALVIEKALKLPRILPLRDGTRDAEDPRRAN